MTSDEFNAQYKLLKQMTVKEGRSYTAEHLPSGRAVLVHVIDGSQVGGLSGLQAMLDQLEPRDKSRVLASLTLDQSVVVVTQFLQGFDGFEPWLRARLAGPPVTESVPSPAAPATHGEFTRLFRAESGSPGPSVPERPPPERPPAAPDLMASAPGASPPPHGSSFTDLFRAAGSPSPGPAHAPENSTLPPVRMVGVRLPPSPEPSSPQREPPGPAPQFEVGGLPQTPAEQQPPRLVPNFDNAGPSAPPGQPPRLLPNLDREAEPAVSPSLAGWPRADELVIRSPDSPVAPLPLPSWDGPSEYTRQLSAVSPPSGELAQAAEVSPPAGEPAAPKRSYVPLFVILNVVFILVTGLVVYFALRRC